MKKILSCAIILFVSITITALADEQKEKTPAFPGAEGYGRYVTGGRGGKVYHVTNLDDSGEGSLRWAIQQSGARTIVFDVCGTIYLDSQLKISNGDVTIAGQSAPGDGICITGYDLTIAAPNVILRYLRIRPSDTSGGEPDGLGGFDGKNIIVDHCSVSWSVDECLSVYGNEHMTVQWCIVSQSLRNSTHSKSAHGYGGIWGGKGASYHHNLMAHHDSRTPRFGNRPTYNQMDTTDYRNNVIYNWAGNGCYGGEGMKINMVNNYYKPGPGTDERASGSRSSMAYRICGLGVSTDEDDGSYHIWGKYYVDGNENPDYPTLVNNNWDMGIYPQISSSSWGYTTTTKDTMKLSEPLPFMYVTTHSASDAYEKVLDYAGCSKKRDWIDELIVSDTRNREATYTGSGDGNVAGIIDSPYDLVPDDATADWTPYPELSVTRSYVDLDGDGMDDNWEDVKGLDCTDPSDGNNLNSEGYTMLEVYLNSLVSSITTAQNEGGVAEGFIEYDDPYANLIKIPATEDIDLEKGDIEMASNGKNKATIKDGKADSFSHEDNITFSLYNTEKSAYTVSFGGATIRDDCKFSFEITDNTTSKVVIDTTIVIENTGEWQTYKDYSFVTSILSEGTITLKITFLSSSGQYTGNMKDLMFTLNNTSEDIKTVSSENKKKTFYTIDGMPIENRMNRLKKGIYVSDKKKVLVR